MSRTQHTQGCNCLHLPRQKHSLPHNTALTPIRIRYQRYNTNHLTDQGDRNKLPPTEDEIVDSLENVEMMFNKDSSLPRTILLFCARYVWGTFKGNVGGEFLFKNFHNNVLVAFHATNQTRIDIHDYKSFRKRTIAKQSNEKSWSTRISKTVRY